MLQGTNYGRHAYMKHFIWSTELTNTHWTALSLWNLSHLARCWQFRTLWRPLSTEAEPIVATALRTLILPPCWTILPHVSIQCTCVIQFWKHDVQSVLWDTKLNYNTTYTINVYQNSSPNH